MTKKIQTNKQTNKKKKTVAQGRLIKGNPWQIRPVPLAVKSCSVKALLHGALLSFCVYAGAGAGALKNDDVVPHRKIKQKQSHQKKKNKQRNNNNEKQKTKQIKINEKQRLEKSFSRTEGKTYAIRL